MLVPKIDAPTVAEHRAQVQARLVDAAEELLRTGEPNALTAAAVSSAAGIARNSIYRYVDSVDDLLGMVLARHLPEWIEGVEKDLSTVAHPADRVVTWLTSNLTQAHLTGHGWLMGLARQANLSPATEKVMHSAHAVMRDAIAQAWMDVAPDAAAARLGAGLTRGLLESGFRLLDAGVPLDDVIQLSSAATRGMIDHFSSR